jgi:hypothetical protein
VLHSRSEQHPPINKGEQITNIILTTSAPKEPQSSPAYATSRYIH